MKSLRVSEMLLLIIYLSTDMQHKCKMLAVEKYTSKLFHRSHRNWLKFQLYKRVDKYLL